MRGNETTPPSGRQILPAHAGSGASVPGMRLDFRRRETRCKGRDKTGDFRNRASGILADDNGSSAESPSLAGK
jgi:hypothetical protein